ncbi:MAG: tetratricopeptide repeat protein [Bacteroidia bacterium]
MMALKKYFIFLITLLSYSSLTAQQVKIDSLKNELKFAKNDTTKGFVLLALADIVSTDSVWQRYNAAALSLAEKNIPLAATEQERQAFLKIKASAFNNIGYDKETKGDLTNALYYYYESLKIEKQLTSQTDIAFLLNNIADIYETQGNVSRALEYYDQSLKMHEKANNKIGIAQAYNNIGFIYSTQGDLDKALDYYQRSYKIKKELNDQRGIGISLSNIGYIYDQKKLEYKAMSYYLLALKIAQEIEDKERMSLIHSNIAGIFKNQGNNKLALINFLTGLKLSEELGDKDGIAHRMCSVGSMYLINGKTDSALYYGTKSMEKAKEIGSPELISNAAELLKKTYKAKGNIAKALEFTEEYYTMRDSINSEQTRKATYKQQLNYEYDKKETIAKAQEEKKDSEHASEIKRQKIVIWAVVIGFLLILVFSISLYKRFTLTREQKKIIEKQKSTVDEKNKEILDSINYAKRLQEAILPPLKYVKEYLPQSFILYKPKDIVAGDFYWMEVVEQDPELILIAAADCTGHGVPGALVSVVCSNSLNRTVKEFGITEPGKILDKVRELVIETFEKSESEVKDGMDISLCCFNKKTNELFWAGANNPLWMIRNNPDKNSGKELIEYKATKQPIGKVDNAAPFQTSIIKLNKEDAVYIFTDGYADQFGLTDEEWEKIKNEKSGNTSTEKGKKFKYSKLKELLISIQHLSMEEQSKIVSDKIDKWKGDIEQVDDILIIGIKI